MEFGSVLQFLENKTILVTVFVEKILRVQPNVKKLYLLLRAADATSASHRFQNEVIGKDLFRVAKEKWDANLNSIIAKKISIVPGDVRYEDLGIKDSSLKEEMKIELDIVLNFAATTKFVESSGLIPESPYCLGQTLNGVSKLDIEEEKKLIDEKINELQAEGAPETMVKRAMKDMGNKSKDLWMAKHIRIYQGYGRNACRTLKENVPAAIIRPTMITATCKEPFPGWIEGASTVDALTLAYGKGKLSFFAVDSAAIADVIPGDIVVNAIILAMVAHANQPCNDIIYHVGSPARNPIRCSDIEDYRIRYFTNKPWIGKNGKPVKVVSKITIFNSIAKFHRFIRIRYLPLLKVCHKHFHLIIFKFHYLYSFFFYS
ncbi:hypothetical protein P3X46_034993, partial [Hevea brasiliensis]